MSDNVDLRADDLALLHECTPAGIGQHTGVIAREEIRPGERERLAVEVEFFERRLIDGERCDARLLRACEHRLCGQSLTRGKL